MSTYMATVPHQRRRPAVLTVMLALVMALFIGILIYVWVETKRAHPIYLDEHGQPVNQQTSGSTH